jgi:hypothetical protein
VQPPEQAHEVLGLPVSPPEQREQRVSPRQEQRVFAAVQALRQASFSPLSLPHPLLLSLPLQPLPPELRLPRLPESSYEPFPRRRWESNSSASSFP